MSVGLVTLALVIALVSVPTVGGLTAWGLTGGDGEAPNAFVALLGAAVGFGSIYNAAISFSAYFGDLWQWQWLLMLVPPGAGVLALLLYDGDDGDTKPSERLLGLALQLVLAIPAGLLLASDAVSLG